MRRLSSYNSSSSQDLDLFLMKLSNSTSTLYLFTKQQILASSKLKVFAGKNFKLDENGKKFSKIVENTVGKGEIAH